MMKFCKKNLLLSWGCIDQLLHTNKKQTHLIVMHGTMCVKWNLFFKAGL